MTIAAASQTHTGISSADRLIRRPSGLGDVAAGTAAFCHPGMADRPALCHGRRQAAYRSGVSGETDPGSARPPGESRPRSNPAPGSPAHLQLDPAGRQKAHLLHRRPCRSPPRPCRASAAPPQLALGPQLDPRPSLGRCGPAASLSPARPPPGRLPGRAATRSKSPCFRSAGSAPTICTIPRTSHVSRPDRPFARLTTTFPGADHQQRARVRGQGQWAARPRPAIPCRSKEANEQAAARSAPIRGA